MLFRSKFTASGLRFRFVWFDNFLAQFSGNEQAHFLGKLSGMSVVGWIFSLAVFGVALIVLTNWTGTTGFTMALAAYVLATFGARARGEQPLHWPSFIAIGILAYTVAAPWIPPSLIKTVQSASADLDIRTPGAEKAAIVAGLAAVIAALHFLFQRRRTPLIFRFFVYYTLITGTILLSKLWFGKEIGRAHV